MQFKAVFRPVLVDIKLRNVISFVAVMSHVRGEAFSSELSTSHFNRVQHELLSDHSSFDRHPAHLLFIDNI
jgi:hypothetical protein